MKGMKVMKKIVALSAGVLMLGATIGSAMAVDLGDYPSPFAGSTGYNGKIVVGSKALAIDIVGSVNVAASFTGASGQGQVVIETAIGSVANAVAFDQLEADGVTTVDEMPMKGEDRSLKFRYRDSEWSFMKGFGNDKITEDLVIEITAGDGDSDCEPQEAISVDTFDYSYEDKTSELKSAVDRILRRSGDSEEFKYNIDLFGVKYQVVATGVDVSAASKSDKYTSLTGEDLMLKRTNSDAYVIRGDEIQLDAFGYPGYTLKVVRISENVGSDTGRITVALLNDGVEVDQATIDEGTNGDVLYDDDDDMSIDVVVDEVSYDASTSEYFGKISFTSGEKSVGDYLDADEIWSLDTLELGGTYTSPELLIEISVNAPGENEDDWECIFDDNQYLYKGQSLGMLDYLELGFTELSSPVTGTFDVKINSDGNLEIRTGSNVYMDVGEEYAGRTFTFDIDTWDLIKITNVKDDDLPTFNLNTDDAGEAADFWIDDDSDKVYTVEFNGSDLVITEPELAGYTELIIAGIDETAGWTNVNVLDGDDIAVRVGSKTDYGTKVTSYSNSGKSAGFEIVEDAVRYQVYAGKSVSSSGNELTVGVGEQAVSGTVKRVGASPLPVGLAILDSDLSSADAVKNDHYIVVGGPCANSAAAALLGVGGDNCGDGFTPGEAMIRLFTNGDKYQLLVAGAEGQDTLLATKVLGSYATYATKFEGKTEVKVKGTKLSDVEITG